MTTVGDTFGLVGDVQQDFFGFIEGDGVTSGFVSDGVDIIKDVIQALSEIFREQSHSGIFRHGLVLSTHTGENFDSSTVWVDEHKWASLPSRRLPSNSFDGFVPDKSDCITPKFTGLGSSEIVSQIFAVGKGKLQFFSVLLIFEFDFSHYRFNMGIGGPWDGCNDVHKNAIFHLIFSSLFESFHDQLMLALLLGKFNLVAATVTSKHAHDVVQIL